jgi:hypothetical protein
MGQTIRGIQLVGDLVLDMADSMEPINENSFYRQKTTILTNFEIFQETVTAAFGAARVFDNQAESFFHYKPGIIYCVTEFSNVKLMLRITEPQIKAAHEIDILRCSSSSSIKSGLAVEVATISLPIISIPVITISVKTVSEITFGIPAITVETVGIETSSVKATAIPTISVVSVCGKTLVVKAFAVKALLVISMAVKSIDIVSAPVITIGVEAVAVVAVSVKSILVETLRVVSAQSFVQSFGTPRQKRSA